MWIEVRAAKPSLHFGVSGPPYQPHPLHPHRFCISRHSVKRAAPEGKTLFPAVTARRMHILAGLVNIFLEEKRTFRTLVSLWEWHFFARHARKPGHDSWWSRVFRPQNLVTPTLCVPVPVASARRCARSRRVRFKLEISGIRAGTHTLTDCSAHATLAARIVLTSEPAHTQSHPLNGRSR